jgi:hypothetical protein
MKEFLQSWFDKWLLDSDSKLLWKERALAQILFVRDEISALIWAGVPYEKLANEGAPRNNVKITGYVIGEHRSKSVRLPVYLLERPDLGIRIVLRGNFSDWKLSVVSERPIRSDLFPYLFHTMPPVGRGYTGNELSPVFFEGFPADLIFGYQEVDPRRWSASLGSREQLWTTILLCMRSVGAIQPLVPGLV